MSRTRKIWTEAEREELRSLFPDTPTTELARRYGVSYSALCNQAYAMGLCKSKEYLEAVGRFRKGRRVSPATEFKPGHKAWNKGTKGLSLGGEATWFRKGSVPHTCLPVGTIVSDTDGYWKEKIAEPNRWVYVHRKLWEAAHGPIPKGMALVFRDGNKNNYQLDNLDLITRRELMARNTIHNYPQPIKDVICMRAGLVKTINHRSKKREEEPDDRYA